MNGMAIPRGAPARRRRRVGDVAFAAINQTLLIAISLICLLPYVSLLAKSLSAERYVISGAVKFWPMGFDASAYGVLIAAKPFQRAFLNSVFVTALGTAVQVFFTICVGYAVAKRDLPGGKLINALYILTMLFNAGLVPTYLVVRYTGLVNNLLVLVIPGMVSAFNLILVRNYFASQPISLEEAARIDGAGNMTILFKVMLPISMPIIATISIYCAVSIWNNYMGPLIYLTKSNVSVLPLFLQQLISSTAANNLENPDALDSIATETFKAAAIFISATPILLVYPFLQTYLSPRSNPLSTRSQARKR